MHQKEVAIEGVRTWLTADPLKFISRDTSEVRILDEYVGYFNFEQPDLYIGEAVRQDRNIKVFGSSQEAIEAARKEAEKLIRSIRRATS